MEAKKERFKKGDVLVCGKNSVEIIFDRFAGYDANGWPVFQDSEGDLYHFKGWYKKGELL
jgi:hypothetical protein